MPGISDIIYSRDSCIAAVRDYYDFLIKMYLNECQVIYPPKGGWPSIVNANPDRLAELGKTDEIVSLLAHLPYIRHLNNWNDDAHGAAQCMFADWQELISGLCNGHMSGNEIRIVTESAEFYENAPSHVIGLTCGGRDNPVMVLDTQLGIVHWTVCPDPIAYEPSRERMWDDPYEYAPENEADWRNDAPAWAITDFFELLKDQFRDLHWIPISPRKVLSEYTAPFPGQEGVIPMLADIDRQHDWPDLTRYRKDECLAAVRKALKERYPDEVDVRDHSDEDSESSQEETQNAA